VRALRVGGRFDGSGGEVEAFDGSVPDIADVDAVAVCCADVNPSTSAVARGADREQASTWCAPTRSPGVS
jgi:hypothetical protein